MSGRTCHQCKNWCYPARTTGWDVIAYRVKYPAISKLSTNEEVFLYLEAQRLEPLVGGMLLCKPNNCWVSPTSNECPLYEPNDNHIDRNPHESFWLSHQHINKQIQEKERRLFGYRQKMLFGKKRKWVKNEKIESGQLLQEETVESNQSSVT